MGMSVGGGGGGKVKSEPNVVPMIDIMLVLLIIFMMIIPQLLSGFTATPPRGINLKPQKDDDRDQVLGLDKFGQYYWNKQLIAPEALADTIIRVYSDRDDQILFVRADKDLEYGKILDALDVVSKHGVAVAAMISDQTPNTQSTVASDLALEAQQAGGGGGN